MLESRKTCPMASNVYPGLFSPGQLQPPEAHWICTFPCSIPMWPWPSQVLKSGLVCQISKPVGHMCPETPMEVTQHFCTWHHGPMSKDHTLLLTFLSLLSGLCVLGHWEMSFPEAPSFPKPSQTFPISQCWRKFLLATRFLVSNFEEFCQIF